MPDRVTYKMSSNCLEQDTLSFLVERLKCIDEVTIKKIKNNVVTVRIKYGLRNDKVKFTVSNQEVIAVMRYITSNKTADKIWDVFLKQILAHPTVFRNIKVADGKPEIVRAEVTSPEYRDKTTYKTDYSPTLWGWKSETKVYHEKEVISGRKAKVLYSNGRYYEGPVFAGGKLERELYDYQHRPHDYLKEIQELCNK